MLQQQLYTIACHQSSWNSQGQDHLHVLTKWQTQSLDILGDSFDCISFIAPNISIWYRLLKISIYFLFDELIRLLSLDSAKNWEGFSLKISRKKLYVFCPKFDRSWSNLLLHPNLLLYKSKVKTWEEPPFFQHCHLSHYEQHGLHDGFLRVHFVFLHSPFIFPLLLL